MTKESDTTSADVKALGELADVILPGDGRRWPAASEAIDPIARVREEFGYAETDWLSRLARDVANLSRAERPRHLSAVERIEPDRFERLVAAVYCAYYTSPAVLRVIEAIAETGPHEASATFDNSLVAKVLATRAGQRRL